MKLWKFGLILFGTIVAALLVIWSVATVHALTPQERKIALHAQAQLDEAIAHDTERSKEIAGAKTETANALSVAALAADSALAAGQRAALAEAQVKAQHDELVRCATENAKNRELIKQVTGPWWFPGGRALLYGIRKCTLSLVVVFAIVAVIYIGLKVFAPGALTAIGFAGKAVKGFGSTAIASAKRLLPKRKPKPPE